MQKTRARARKPFACILDTGVIGTVCGKLNLKYSRVADRIQADREKDWLVGRIDTYSFCLGRASRRMRKYEGMAKPVL